MIITRKIYPSRKPAEAQQHALIKEWYFFCVHIFWKEVENILPTLYFRKVKCPWWISKANLSGMCSPCQDTESRRDRRKLLEVQTGDKTAVIEEPAQLRLLITTQPFPALSL